MGDTEVTGGIRQGCTMAGLQQLFVMVVNIIINSIVIKNKRAINVNLKTLY